MWRDLPEEQKQDYVDAFEAEKVPNFPSFRRSLTHTLVTPKQIEYNEQLKIYHNSPAYQSWIANLKTKEHEERESHKAKNKKAVSTGGHGLNSPVKGHDGRVSLVQTMEGELEDEDDYYSIKHLSAARFYRNHKLVADIFGDAVVPDSRTNAANRYQILRRQADSLAMHHQTLHQELAQIEEKFQERKRALLDSSERFSGEFKRFASKPVDEATYQKMVERALEQIKRENGVLPPVQAVQAPVTTNSEGSSQGEAPTTEPSEKAEKAEESSTNENTSTTAPSEPENPTATTEQQPAAEQ